MRVRWADLSAVTRAVTLEAPVAATGIITEIAEDLVRSVLADHPEQRTISLLAISVSHLELQPTLQLELALGFADEARRPGSRRGASRLFADRAMDKVRDPLRLGGHRLWLGGAGGPRARARRLPRAGGKRAVSSRQRLNLL